MAKGNFMKINGMQNADGGNIVHGVHGRNLFQLVLNQLKNVDEEGIRFDKEFLFDGSSFIFDETLEFDPETGRQEPVTTPIGWEPGANVEIFSLDGSSLGIVRIPGANRTLRGHDVWC